MSGDDRTEFLQRVIRGVMYHEISTAIRCLLRPLVALALLDYSEIVGGWKTIHLGDQNWSRRNFDAFFEVMKRVNPLYANFEKELETKRMHLKDRSVYSVVRCGLVHEYLIKGGKTLIQSDPSDPDGRGEGLGTPPCGLYFEDDRLVLDVNRYFRDFQLAVNLCEKELAG